MTGPYYSDDHATLWLGAAEECFDWLSADVLIFDPPYGIAYQSGARRDTLASSILNDGDTSVRDRALTDWGPTKPALVFGSWRIPRPTAARARLIWDTGWALTPTGDYCPRHKADRGPDRGRRARRSA